MSTPPDIALFVGRLHPLVVHLPIALLLLLAVLESLASLSRFKHANSNSGIILAIAIPGALLAAGCGWLLSLGGGYQEQLLRWHKWTGIATAIFCLVAALLYALNLRKPYRWTLFSGCVVLLVASHFGGSLTHGSDYLVRYAPGPLRSWLKNTDSSSRQPKSVGAMETAVYAKLVQPILKENCLSCHGPEKSKGGLRLDSLQALLKGGENGPAIVPGKPSEGLLLQRVRLPISHDDHMPPDGKPQPSADDIAVLEWWIQAGASTNKTVSELKAGPLISRIVQARLGLPERTAATRPPNSLPQVLPVAEKLAQDLGIVLSTIVPAEPWLQCNASLAGTNFGDAELKQLVPLASNLKWLDLGGTAVTDSGLPAIATMLNLKRLHLERTAITDTGLEHLGGLSQLEYLNLHHTAITDAGINALRPLQNLKQLYLWGTEVSPETARNLAELRTDKSQIERWREEIEQLNTKIREARFIVDTGVPVNSPVTNSMPVNSQCPVTGKAVDTSKTVLHEGKLIAFCCDDCKVKFQQDPKAYLPKLQPLMPVETKTAEK